MISYTICTGRYTKEKIRNIKRHAISYENVKKLKKIRQHAISHQKSTHPHFYPMSYHLLQARSGFTLLDGTRIPGHDLPMMTRTSYDFKWTEISFAGRQFTAIYIPYLVREEREKMLFVSHIFLAPSFLFLPSFGRE